MNMGISMESTADRTPFLREEAGLPKWSTLYHIVAVATITMLLLIPVQIAVYSIWPTPQTVVEWFELFQSNWALGLMHLDLVYIVNNTIVAMIYLAFYMSLRRRNEGLMLTALLTGLMGISAYYASNPAFEMLSLSRQFAQCTSDVEKTILLASGQVMISQWKGTAFDIYYELNAISLIITAGIMFKSAIYSKATAVIGLISGILMLIPSTAGTLGLVFALASLVPWMVFSALVAVRFFRLSRLGRTLLEN